MRRKWIFWLLVIAFVWLVVTRFAEVKKLFFILSQGQWQWLVAAVLLQGLFYSLYALIYQRAFAVVEVRSQLRHLIPLVVAAVFVNVAAPSGGASGVALFADDAARRKESSARAAAGGVLVLAADYSAFSLVLIPGLFYLFTQHQLQSYQIVGAAVLGVFIIGLTGVVLLGLLRPGWLRGLLEWVERAAQKTAGWLKRPAPLSAGWAAHIADDYIAAGNAVGQRPGLVLQTLGAALAAHLVDLLSLYAIFQAYHQPISFGALVSGFTMGILFWVVSITPQGIGVVEGVMALVFTSLGVQPEMAAAIAIAFRGMTFWLPFFIGFILLRRFTDVGPREESVAETWSVRVPAILTMLMGIINMLSALTPALAARLAMLEQISPLEVRAGLRFTAALAGFALILLSNGLWRRKRAAWLVTVGVLVLSAASHLLKGLDYEEALLALGLAAWLFSQRAHFHARSDPPSVRQGLRVLVIAAVFTLAYGMLGFYLLDRHFGVHFDFNAAVRQTLIMFAYFYDPGLVPLTTFGRYFAASIYAVGVATGGYALFSLIRPVLVRQPATPAERERARRIVEDYGHTTLARFCLFDDKSYFFSPGGSMIAFAMRSRVAVALGDPIGPAEDAPAAIKAFVGHCRTNDWQPAFYQTLPDYLEDYRAAGLEALCIGHEAVVDLGTFTLQGSAAKPVRNAVTRIQRLGYTAEVHAPPIPDGLIAEMQAISNEWLTTQHGREMRFSLGWFDPPYVQACPAVTVRTPEGELCAFATVIPEYQAREAAVDLMRRRARVENGVMETLFVTLFEWARAQGYATFNLGLSGLSGVGEKHDDPVVERALHVIYERVNQFYNFKGLHTFKSKFQPQWQPRYLVHPGVSGLAEVALALAQVHS